MEGCSVDPPAFFVPGISREGRMGGEGGATEPYACSLQHPAALLIHSTAAVCAGAAATAKATAPTTTPTLSGVSHNRVYSE